MSAQLQKWVHSSCTRCMAKMWTFSRQGGGGRTTPPTPPPPRLRAWTPYMIIFGNDMHDNDMHKARYVMYIEGVKCVEVKNILAGFIIVFMSYYVFWLEYPEDLRCTLMHIQTIIYGRNNDTVIQYHLDS